MADPVSWQEAAQATETNTATEAKLGTVDEVLGDSSLDIFDGLAVASGVLGKPRYVPAELVAEIVEGSVRLSIAGDEFGRLDEYEAPGTRRA